MDGILPSLLGFALLMTVSLTVGSSGLRTYQSLGQSWQDAEELSEQRINSDISIASINPNGFDVSVTLLNEGKTPIVDYSAMDVVVQYSTGSETVIDWVSHAAPLQPNSWTVGALLNDAFEPRVLNSGESALLQVCLDPAPAAGSINWLQITTGLGISAADSFMGVSQIGGCSACTAGDTGLRDAGAEAATTGGTGDGFEQTPTGAFANGGSFASNQDGPGDRHLYYDYGIAVSSLCDIVGIEVRLDWWVGLPLDTNSASVELSWDGGATWTAAKTDTQTSTSEQTAVLGSPSDDWGRTWSPLDLVDDEFRVRITTDCSGLSCALQDFFLDWLSVRVYYAPA
ncbi:MAG: hypothetical protein WD939_01385 [Dehalococcoidia bacterium]